MFLTRSNNLKKALVAIFIIYLWNMTFFYIIAKLKRVSKLFILMSLVLDIYARWNLNRFHTESSIII